MRRLIVFLVIVLLGNDARAQVSETNLLTTVDRADMMAILRQAALDSVVDGTTDEVSPWVMGKTASGLNVVVDFFQCDAGNDGPRRKCSEFRFKVYWDNVRKIDAAAVDAYNEKYIFGRGFVSGDGKYVVVDYAMDLDGGVARDHILKNLNYFLLAVKDFSALVTP